MAIIYKPKGKALEYSPLAANLYKGCSHACKYCFAPRITYTDANVFTSPEYIRPRPDVIEQLKKDAVKFQGTDKNVLLSFTTDPYQPINDKLRLTREALIILKDHDIPVTILTKGGLKACKDFDILAQHPHNAFSVTLTSDKAIESLSWELGAASPYDRVQSLRIAHDHGIKTWVSFEPVINPDAVIRLIKYTHNFVDLYKVGKLNYHHKAQTIDWQKFLFQVEVELDKYGKERYIKKDLEAYRQ